MRSLFVMWGKRPGKNTLKKQFDAIVEGYRKRIEQGAKPSDMYILVSQEAGRLLEYICIKESNLSYDAAFLENVLGIPVEIDSAQEGFTLELRCNEIS